MTNEEIEKVAASLVARGHDQEFHPTRQEIAEAIRELVAQAYEEAARQMCDFCAAGVGLVKHELTGELYHPAVSGEQYPRFIVAVGAHLCFAVRIQKLRDSLLQSETPCVASADRKAFD